MATTVTSLEADDRTTVAEAPVPDARGTAAPDDRSGTPASPGIALSVAALASLVAGAIHATAAGSHSEHRAAVVAFAAVAAFQIAWGALALVRSWRWLPLVGAVGNAAAFGGWVMAKTVGIGFVAGLDTAESPQFADTLAAALAAVAVVGALLALVGRLGWVRRPHPGLVAVSAVAALGLVLPGMVEAGNHQHAHDEAAGHDQGATGAGHADAVVPPQKFDPKKPIDLSGVPGVTPEQQAEAENLLAINLLRLPQWKDTATAAAAGYHSIGDAITGDEHYINWKIIEDHDFLDPDHPESLVYHVDRATGKRTLEAAMYILPPSYTLNTVPNIGGKLIQWHIHNNLCFKPGDAPKVAQVADPSQECAPGLVRFPPAPMIHVWIVPNPCGPFAALEGVGAGQVKPGESRACDHVHGS